MCVFARARALVLLAIVLIFDELPKTNMRSHVGDLGDESWVVGPNVEWTTHRFQQFLLFWVGHVLKYSIWYWSDELARPLMDQAALLQAAGSGRMQEDRSGEALSEQSFKARAWTKAYYWTDNNFLTCRQIVSQQWKNLFDRREVY
jgi:hypothetical protein